MACFLHWNVNFSESHPYLSLNCVTAADLSESGQNQATVKTTQVRRHRQGGGGSFVSTPSSSGSSSTHSYTQMTLRKTAILLSKNCQKIDIFSKKIEKKIFFQQKCQVFGSFLTVKWQFSGWSALISVNQVTLVI